MTSGTPDYSASAVKGVVVRGLELASGIFNQSFGISDFSDVVGSLPKKQFHVFDLGGFSTRIFNMADFIGFTEVDSPFISWTLTQKIQEFTYSAPVPSSGIRQSYLNQTPSKTFTKFHVRALIKHTNENFTSTLIRIQGNTSELQVKLETSAGTSELLTLMEAGNELFQDSSSVSSNTYVEIDIIIDGDKGHILLYKDGVLLRDEINSVNTSFSSVGFGTQVANSAGGAGIGGFIPIFMYYE